MRGDFSQIRFNRQRNYTAVLEQQGRVALDADANEQCFIDAYQSGTQAIDVVGRYGGPAGDTGFQVTVTSGHEILIGAGRYYVNGLLCENPASLSYDGQPYLIAPPDGATAASLISKLTAPGGAGVIQVWLQVWQRLQTALDDPCLREPALGHADTTARLQTVWRVVADLVPTPQLPPGSPGPAPSCCQAMDAAAAPQASTGTMSAAAGGPSRDCGCEPVAAAGYQGIENQLYRVEIHRGGNETRATFKWSRENGSVVTAITGISGPTVGVCSLGPDANLGFQAGQWVELTDDSFVFGPTPNSPGALYQIQSIHPADLSVTLAVPAGDHRFHPGPNSRMRRWDQSGPTATEHGIPLSAGTRIPLENGIEVKFAPGTFQSGDYWTIPARAASGQIEWPPCGSDGNASQPPSSVVVYSAPLASIAPGGPGSAGGVVVEDCRQKFSPLTALAPPTAIEAIHVARVSWVNDDVVTLDTLLTRGLTITLDQVPTSPLSGANVIVTVESAQAAVGSANPPPDPGTYLRTVTVIDTAVTLNGSDITWRVPTESTAQLTVVSSLDTSVSPGAAAQQWAKVRIRLLGQMIYAAGAAGPVYLDGLALGQPGVRQDNCQRIDLRLPSGAGVVASDFEGWLYVAPCLIVTKVTVTPPALTVSVGPGGQVRGTIVTGSSPPEAVTPTAVITVNYPALADATVTISVPPTATGVTNIVTVPGTATILRGQTSVSVPISVVGNPGAGTTLNFSISASTTALFGGPVVATGFWVTGAAAG
jgi:hypothetical protein